MCQKAYSGIASGRQGLGKSGLWPAAGTKKEREPGKPALLLFARYARQAAAMLAWAGICRATDSERHCRELPEVSR